MSTRRVRTIHDFLRHGRDVELVCGCGHRAVLPFLPVVKIFAARKWPIGLGAAVRRFRCSRCGGTPRQLGPLER